MPAATDTQLSTLDAIEQRRSVKHYQTGHTIPAADKTKLQELAMLSPTSFNMQNWRFVWVEDAEVRQQLLGAAWNQAQVTDASAVLVLCADLGAYANNPARYWVNAPEPVQEALVPMIKPFYDGKPELQRDEAMRSVGIASQTLMLAAKAMGYDTCPMIGFDPEQVAEIINLPENHVIGMMLTIGVAKQPANPRGGSIPKAEAWFENTF